MNRATLDVYVLVAECPGSGGTRSQLIERWLAREFDLVLSESMANDEADVW